MSLLPRHLFPSLGRWTAGLLLALITLAAAAGLFLAARCLPGAAAPAPSVPVPVSENSDRRIALPLEGWASFRMDGEAVKQVSGNLSGRFRLVGIFRVIQPGETNLRKAVLADLSKKEAPAIVATGDRLEDGIWVRSIEESRLELVQQDVACVLTLDYIATNGVAEAGAGAAGGTNDPLQGYPVLSRSTLGIEVEAGHYILERGKVLEYYNAVLEDSDRLVALFDSLKPLYGEDKKISGYILIPEGEADFFKDVGLKEGDVMRKVNSVPLMNRRVAEGFIRDFGKNELGTAVLEIERAGETNRLVYELR